MKTKNQFRLFCMFLCIFCWISCNDENISNEQSLITAKGIGDNLKSTLISEDSETPVIFTGDDILWFNDKTREIKFKQIEPIKEIGLYKQLLFELDGKVLFTTLTMVQPINSQIYTDLVLYVELIEGKYRYYLNDGYPVWAAEMDEAKANAAMRADSWKSFIVQLEKEGKLRNEGELINHGHISSRKILDPYFITSIAFDKDGNAWIGTFKQGLIKYNEQETTYFNSTNSLFTTDMVINSIATDRKGSVWIGSDGLIRYDGNKFSIYNSTNSPIPEDYIHSLNIDSRDNIWFSSSRFQQGGLVRFDGKSKWKVFTPQNSTMPGHLISSIAIKNSEVWVALNDYVDNAFLVKINNDQITRYTAKNFGFSPYYLGDICVDSKSKLYLLNDYSLSSLMYNEGPHLISFDGKYTQKIYCPYADLYSMTIDSNDNLWCIPRQSKDILVYKNDEWHVLNIFNKKDTEQAIFCIQEAPDGKIWVGTAKGVYIIDGL